MKRLLLIVLAALLLAGCGGRKNPSPEDSGDTSQTEETLGLYIPGSSVEQQSGGAVRAYGLEDDTYFDISAMGSHLLVLGQKGLTVLSGEQGTVTATLKTDEIRPNSVTDIAATGFAYYLPNSRQVVVLNPQLQKVTQVELPKEIVDNPCISIVKNEVFYSTGSEIRALNMTTGISRLIRQQTTVSQSLLGAYFDGTVLLCRFTDESGGESRAFISAETGQTVSPCTVDVTMQTYGTQYFAFWQDGTMVQNAFGAKDTESKSLLTPYPDADAQGGRAAVPTANGMVDHAMTEGGLELTFYDLATGKCTAQTVLPGVQSPIAFYGWNNRLWMLATDGEKTRHALYSWDMSATPVEDETDHTGPVYTAENPNAEGLAQCRTLADTYQKDYGVKILLWQDAVKNAGSYTLTPEHHPQVIQKMLEELQPLLAQFPEKFLLKTVEAGWIRICLVRDTGTDAQWVQFWDKKDCWVILSARADIVPAMLQAMAYGVDSHVLGNSREFDNWTDLNPEGFEYSYKDTAEGYAEYLAGETRAFTDAKAMTYPLEDRCRVFYHAMLPDNAAVFQAPVMQEKLLRLCTGIREAYSLQKKTDTYPWEQYLQTSLAYVPQ